MTVNYNLTVSSRSALTLFKLLSRWKGSIWKALYREVIFFLVTYIIIALVYRNVLNRELQDGFATLASWINDNLRFIQVDFMLGFFVSVVVSRWTVLFANVGLIDTCALTIAGYMTGKSEQERIWRRNVIRYCVLAQVLVFRDISMQVRKRFPTLDTIVAAGFMMPHEQDKFEDLQYDYGKSWMPFQWANSILLKAREQGSIKADAFLDKCVEQVRNFRTNLATLSTFDWVPIPIMYPQIVFMAVHTYFALALIGRQVLIRDDDKVPWFARYFPIMPVLQFMFYMGWLKVAEALLNPLGEDDDDFETNFLIDRNLTMGLTIVDKYYDDPPAQKRDTFWNDPVQPLYTEQSAARGVNPLAGSMAGIELPPDVDSVKMVARDKDTEGGDKTEMRVSIKRNSITSVKSAETPGLKQRKPRDQIHTFAYENDVINEEVAVQPNGEKLMEKASGV